MMWWRHYIFSWKKKIPCSDIRRVLICDVLWKMTILTQYLGIYRWNMNLYAEFGHKFTSYEDEFFFIDIWLNF